MKLLIFPALILLAATDAKYNVREDIAEQWEELYEPHKQECIQESGVHAEDVKHMFKRGHYPDKHEFKCYIKCVALKLKCVTEDGSLNLVNLQNQVKAADLDIVEDAIRSAEDVKDVCEKVFLHFIRVVRKICKRYPPQNEIKK